MRTFKYKGKMLPVAVIAKQAGIPYVTLNKRLKQGQTIDQATAKREQQRTAGGKSDCIKYHQQIDRVMEKIKLARISRALKIRRVLENPI